MKGLSLRSAASVCWSRFRCARTSSGGVSAIHWFSDTQAKCAPRLPRIGRAPLPLIVVCSSTAVKRHAVGSLGGQWLFHSQLSRLSTVAEHARRSNDDPDSDDQREHRSVDRRMNEEKPADCCADSKRNKNPAQAAALIAGYGYSIGHCAEQEDEGSCGSSRKYAPDVKVANSSALHAHC